MAEEDNKSLQYLIFVILAAGAIILGLTFFGLFFGGPTDEAKVTGTLELWTVHSDTDTRRAAQDKYDDFQSGFKALYPNVEIDHRTFEDTALYERTLVSALAAGDGPDIFMVRNNDLLRKADLIQPAPSSKYSTLRLGRDFPQIVKKNFVGPGGSIYALPLSIDTLTLIYNRDLFNEAAVVFPPETWSEFQEDVVQLVKYDGVGNIEQAGAAIGGTNKNIPRAKDILSLLMMQSGVTFVNEKYTRSILTSEGRDPIDFYTRFGDPESSVYTWNESMPNAIEAFSNEEVAMIFDYARNIRAIEERAPFINMEVAPVPQLESPGREISYANYWGYTVSRQTAAKKGPQLSDAAWDFILSMTTNPQRASSYMQATGQPPALSVLIENNLENPEFIVWAKQALTADSWMEPDPERMDEAFSELVRNKLVEGRRTIYALNQLEDAINDILDERK